MQKTTGAVIRTVGELYDEWVATTKQADEANTAEREAWIRYSQARAHRDRIGQGAAGDNRGTDTDARHSEADA